MRQSTAPDLIAGGIIGFAFGAVVRTYLYFQLSDLSLLDIALPIPTAVFFTAAVLLAYWKKADPRVWSGIAGAAIGYIGFQFILACMLLFYVGNVLGIP